MNTHRRFLTKSVLATLLVTGLIAAACGGARPTPAKPTSAPAAATKAKPTAAATAKPAPTQKPAAKPTAAPTAIPTAKPTAAPTAIPTAAPTTAALPLGQIQTVGDLAVQPTKTTWLASNGADKPKSGDSYLVVTLSIENKSKAASATFDPANLTLVDASGALFSMIKLKSFTTEVSSQTLKPGQRLQGVAVFEVPTKEQKSAWKLELKGGSNQSVRWALSG